MNMCNMMMGSGGWMMAAMAMGGLLFIVLIVLAIAALIKYLRAGRKTG